MFKMIANFVENEDGAVTVDWVVLTAAIVSLGLAVMTSISSGVEDNTSDVRDYLTSGISTTF